MSLDETCQIGAISLFQSFCLTGKGSHKGRIAERGIRKTE